MRWLNKYHRGFNRILLVLTGLPVLIMLLYILLSDEHKAKEYVSSDWGRGPLLSSGEDTIAARVQERWRAVQDKPFARPLTDSWFVMVKEMPESKQFSDKELKAIIDDTIESAKTYPARVSEKRRQAIKEFFIMLAVCAGVFAVAHGWFCIAVWVIRGFRDFEK